MNKIEQLVKEVYLKRYVWTGGSLGNIGRSDRSAGNGSGRAGARPSGDGVEEEEVRGIVTTIVGRFIEGGEISSGRKKYVRSVMQVSAVSSQEITHPHFPAITLSDLDFEGIEPHQHNPMVIDIRMANYNCWILGKISKKTIGGWQGNVSFARAE
ncbi:hypothetical protein SESBI_49623 [Sesbania bispinosa]|nr:hypothetical protein SESBI_49623 [Sesbania bispinosa]